MLCSKCKERNSCNKLCKEMENYVNQDYVPQTELTYEDLGLDINNIGITTSTYALYEGMYGTSTNPSDLVYLLYFIDKRSPKYIASCVPFSLRNIYYIINKFKNNINKFSNTELQKKIVTLHVMKRMRPVEIRKELNSDESYIREIISRYVEFILHKDS